MQNGISPIIIDNTNLHAWEMKPYAVMVGRSIILNFPLWAFCEKVETCALSSFFWPFMISHSLTIILSGQVKLF